MGSRGNLISTLLEASGEIGAVASMPAQAQQNSMQSLARTCMPISDTLMADVLRIKRAQAGSLVDGCSAGQPRRGEILCINRPGFTRDAVNVNVNVNNLHYNALRAPVLCCQCILGRGAAMQGMRSVCGGCSPVDA